MNLIPRTGSVSPCFHPGDDTGEVNAAGVHPADDLAADLHLTLTAADEHDLAALAERA